jgi:hypothetical protein
MLYFFDVSQVPLNPRPSYESIITEGKPHAAGRIVALSPDRRTATVIWRGTSGTYSFKPDPQVTDIGYIVYGRLVIKCGPKEYPLGPGSLIEFPREPFQMKIFETFMKVSSLYSADGLKVQLEPLSQQSH